MKNVTILNAVRWVSPEGELPVWSQVCVQPFDRYPRLDPLSKIISVVAEQVMASETLRPEMGLILSTAHGCVEPDLAFYRSAVSTPELASPQLFPYTLPSSGLAEVAIRHKVNGPNMVFLQEAGVGNAFRQAWAWLQSKRVPQCLIVQADAVLAEGARFLSMAPKVEGWAFLVSLDPGECTWDVQTLSGDLAPSAVYNTFIL
jgi:hypothetical protein